jgi:hypothetical protein
MRLHRIGSSETVDIGREEICDERAVRRLLPIEPVCEKMGSELDLVDPGCCPGARVSSAAPYQRDSQRHLLDAKTRQRRFDFHELKHDRSANAVIGNHSPLPHPINRVRMFAQMPGALFLGYETRRWISRTIFFCA